MERSSILLISTKKYCRKRYIFYSIFLSIAKAMVYHHAFACISSPQAYIINRRLYFFRNDDIQNFVLMICNSLWNWWYTTASRWFMTIGLGFHSYFFLVEWFITNLIFSLAFYFERCYTEYAKQTKYTSQGCIFLSRGYFYPFLTILFLWWVW